MRAGAGSMAHSLAALLPATTTQWGLRRAGRLPPSSHPAQSVPSGGERHFPLYPPGQGATSYMSLINLSAPHRVEVLVSKLVTYFVVVANQQYLKRKNSKGFSGQCNVYVN